MDELIFSELKIGVDTSLLYNIHNKLGRYLYFCVYSDDLKHIFILCTV